MLEIILPYPPSINHSKGMGKLIKTLNGKMFQQRFNSIQTNRYFNNVFAIWRNSKLEGLGDVLIYLAVEVYPPDRRKRDLDNVLKVLLDSLQQAGVYKDDNQIVKLLVERKEVKIGGEIIVRIEKCC